MVKLSRQSTVLPLVASNGVVIKSNLSVHSGQTQTTSTTCSNASNNIEDGHHGRFMRGNECDDDDSEQDLYDPAFVMSQDVATNLVSRTQRKVLAFLKKSNWIAANSCLEDLPRLALSDLSLSRVLAEGGFSSIQEITSFHKKEGLDFLESSCGTDEASWSCDDSGASVETTTIPPQGTPTAKRYVVKHLKSELALYPRKLNSAAKDICNEIHVLSALHHQHIIRLYALSEAGLDGVADTRRADSLFLVLERLDQTLLQRMSQWRQRGIKNQTIDLKNLGRCKGTLDLLNERLRAAQQLASALCYLHDRRILHRDIKPGNIGFDNDGCLKLFDFGLAVELPHSDDPRATYDLGVAGTARYHAPEVIRQKPYNTSADVYSFTLVLWEIVSLVKVFDYLSGSEVQESVAQIGCRPPLSKSWPRALKRLMQRGWSKHPSRRPVMADIEVELEGFIESPHWTGNKRSSNWFQGLF